MDRVMVNLTWKCNFGDCPYCWTNMVVRNTSLFKVPDHDWKEWLNVLNNLESAIFDFVGGEPFVFPNFVKLIEHLDAKHYVAVTSNLYSDHLLDALTAISPNQLAHFTCSYHPTGKLCLEDFGTRVLLLKDVGFDVSVNIIDHESIRSHIAEATAYLKAKGVVVHVSPYEHPPDLLKPNKEKLMCNAGVNHYVLNNNGDAYRCLSWFRHPERRKAWLGNVFDGSFKKLENRGVCALPCEMKYTVDPTNTMVKALQIEVAS